MSLFLSSSLPSLNEQKRNLRKMKGKTAIPKGENNDIPCGTNRIVTSDSAPISAFYRPSSSSSLYILSPSSSSSPSDCSIQYEAQTPFLPFVFPHRYGFTLPLIFSFLSVSDFSSLLSCCHHPIWIQALHDDESYKGCSVLIKRIDGISTRFFSTFMMAHIREWRFDTFKFSLHVDWSFVSPQPFPPPFVVNLHHIIHTNQNRIVSPSGSNGADSLSSPFYRYEDDHIGIGIETGDRSSPSHSSLFLDILSQQISFSVPKELNSFPQRNVWCGDDTGFCHFVMQQLYYLIKINKYLGTRKMSQISDESSSSSSFSLSTLLPPSIHCKSFHFIVTNESFEKSQHQIIALFIEFQRCRIEQQTEKQNQQEASSSFSSSSGSDSFSSPILPKHLYLTLTFEVRCIGDSFPNQNIVKNIPKFTHQCEQMGIILQFHMICHVGICNMTVTQTQQEEKKQQHRPFYHHCDHDKAVRLGQDSVSYDQKYKFSPLSSPYIRSFSTSFAEHMDFSHHFSHLRHLVIPLNFVHLLSLSIHSFCPVIASFGVDNSYGIPSQFQSQSKAKAKKVTGFVSSVPVESDSLSIIPAESHWESFGLIIHQMKSTLQTLSINMDFKKSKGSHSYSHDSIYHYFPYILKHLVDESYPQITEFAIVSRLDQYKSHEFGPLTDSFCVKFPSLSSIIVKGERYANECADHDNSFFWFSPGPKWADKKLKSLDNMGKMFINFNGFEGPKESKITFLRQIDTMIPRFRSLKSLTLKEFFVSPSVSGNETLKTLQSLGDNLSSHCRSLIHLHIQPQDKSNSSCILPFIQALPSFPRLTSLDLPFSSSLWSSSALRLLSHSVNNVTHPHLTSLDIRELCDCNIESLSYLHHLLFGLPLLSHLNISIFKLISETNDENSDNHDNNNDNPDNNDNNNHYHDNHDNHDDNEIQSKSNNKSKGKAKSKSKVISKQKSTPSSNSHSSTSVSINPFPHDPPWYSTFHLVMLSIGNMKNLTSLTIKCDVKSMSSPEMNMLKYIYNGNIFIKKLDLELFAIGQSEFTTVSSLIKPLIPMLETNSERIVCPFLTDLRISINIDQQSQSDAENSNVDQETNKPSAHTSDSALLTSAIQMIKHRYGIRPDGMKEFMNYLCTKSKGALPLAGGKNGNKYRDDAEDAEDALC